MSVSTLYYVIGHKYLTVGIICKYFIKLCRSSPLVPHGPLLVRFTNDNINMLKKKRKKFNSHLKRIARKVGLGGGGCWEITIGAQEQQNTGGIRNEIWKVCSVFGGQGFTCQRDCPANGQRVAGRGELSRPSLPASSALNIQPEFR